MPIDVNRLAARILPTLARLRVLRAERDDVFVGVRVLRQQNFVTTEPTVSCREAIIIKI